MTADVLINRTVVHTSATADTAQCLADLGGQHLGASGVNDDYMKFRWTFRIAWAFGSGRERKVIADGLTGSRAGQQSQKQSSILQRRHDFFNPGDRYVDPWQGRRHAAVAFVRNDHRGTGLGHQKIRSAEI